MINLTEQAMKLAERDLIFQYPELDNKTFRQRLSRTDKKIIFQQLLLLASMYEEQLIQQVLQKS